MSVKENTKETATGKNWCCSKCPIPKDLDESDPFPLCGCHGKVEKLPLLGEAETIKSRSQGRVGSVKETLEVGERIEGLTSNARGFKRLHRVPNRNECNSIAGRILRFDKSTDRQKKLARDYISTGKNNLYADKLAGVNMYLTRRYGKKYSNS